MGQVPGTIRTLHNPAPCCRAVFPKQQAKSEGIFPCPISWLKSKYHSLIEKRLEHSANKSEEKGDFGEAARKHLLAAEESADAKTRKEELCRAAALFERIGLGREAGCAYARALQEEAWLLEAGGKIESAALLRFDIAIFSEDEAVKKAEFLKAAELFSSLRWHNRAGMAYHSAMRLESRIEDKLHLAHLISRHYSLQKAYGEMASIWLDLSYESQNPGISRQLFVLAGLCMMRNMQYSDAMNYFFIALRDEANLKRRLEILERVADCLVGKSRWREAGLCLAIIYHNTEDQPGNFAKKWNLAMQIDGCFRHANLRRDYEDVMPALRAAFAEPNQKSEMERLGLLRDADRVFCDIARDSNVDLGKIEAPAITKAA